jgi:integrase
VDDPVVREETTLAAAALPVHEAVRRQLTEDIGEARLLALRAVLDDVAFNVVVRWLSSGRRASLETKRGYAEDVARFAKWVAGYTYEAPVALLTAVDGLAVTVWTIYVRGEGWSAATQRRTLSAVSSLFTYAVKHGVAESNPVDFEEHAPQIGRGANGRPAGATRVLERGQVAALEQACAGEEEHLVFALLYVHGLRVSEMVNLCVEHVDVSGSATVINVQRKGGRWVKRELLPDSAKWLRTVMGGRTSGPVLLDRAHGGARTRFQIIDITRRLARHAGLAEPRRVTPHVLKASATTALLEGGVPMHEVQAWADHASSATTQRYWERANALRRDAALSAHLAAEIAKDGAGVSRAAGGA